MNPQKDRQKKVYIKKIPPDFIWFGGILSQLLFRKLRSVSILANIKPNGNDITINNAFVSHNAPV